MTREIFKDIFQTEKKIIEKIAKKEERGKKSIQRESPKAAKRELTAEERRVLREKLERETAEFLKPVFEGESAEKLARQKKAAAMEKTAVKYEQENTEAAKKMAKEEVERKMEVLIGRESRRRKGHRSEKGEGVYKSHSGGVKPPKHRRTPEVKGV